MTAEGETMDKNRLVSALTEIGRIATEALRGVEAKPTRAIKGLLPAEKRGDRPAEISFGMNILAFTKKYCAHLTGDRKFTLLLAYLTKGETSKRVSLGDMKSHWNKMTSLMGKFNPAYANRAKANDWIDTPIHGSYNLAGGWRSALDRET